MRGQGRLGKTDVASILLGIALIAIGALLSYSGYVWEGFTLNPGELWGSLAFWCAVAYLALAFPLRRAATGFLSYIRRPFESAVFAAYLAVHLVLDGFLLEAILSVVYGPGYVVYPGFLLTTDVFGPPSLLSAILDLAYNPSILATVPPVFTVALNFYGISMASVIAVLVVANVGRTRELGELCTRAGRARSFVLLPALGVVLGASCCLSVAGLLSVVVPSASALTSVLWVYYTTYFIFPSLAVVLLWLNLSSIERVSSSLGPPVPR